MNIVTPNFLKNKAPLNNRAYNLTSYSYFRNIPKNLHGKYMILKIRA